MPKSQLWMMCGWLFMAGLACQHKPPHSASSIGQQEIPDDTARANRQVAGSAVSESRCELGPLRYAGHVREVTTGGTLRVDQSKLAFSPQRSAQSLLAIIKTSTPQGPQEQLFRSRIVGPFAKDLNVRLPRGVAKSVNVGDHISLYVYRHDDRNEFRPIPARAVLRREPVPAIAQSYLNIFQIVRGIAGFHDQYNCFPPAVLRGPDGKPWHSWRVLILPFMGEEAIYDEYRLAEPWDSPHNRQVLLKMPDVYRDPAYGKPNGAERNFTHYAVVTGVGTAFTSEGLQFQSASAVLPGEGPRRSYASVMDGSSNSAVVGVVGPQAKIPWTKPLDLAMGPDFPELGRAGGFATPYHVRGLAVGVFGSFVGSLHLVPCDTKPETLRALLEIGDGKIVSEQEVPSVRIRGIEPKWWLTFKTTSAGSIATLACDPEIEAVQPYRAHLP